MATKYHISEGELRKCSAHIEECPLILAGEETEHFTGTPQEAKVWFEEGNASKAGGSFGTLPPAPKKVKKDKVYRVGTLKAPDEYFKDLDGVLSAMDSVKPEGRQGRRGGIFASPDLSSHSRWVLGSKWNAHEGALDSHELTVDANSVYVYNVKKYEEASYAQNRYGEDREEFVNAAKEFWDSGMTLSDWREWAKHNDTGSGDWEVIMPADSIMSSAKVSNKRIIENTPDGRSSEMNSLLEHTRWMKGLIWRKSDLTEDETELIREESAKKLSPEFIADMEALYAKNAYREKDISSAKKPILRTLHSIRQKRDENAPDLIDSEKEDVIKDVYTYIKIVDSVRDIRKAAPTSKE